MATLPEAVRHEHKLLRRRRRQPGNVLAIRLRELNLLLTCRYGGELLPDLPDTRHAVAIVAHHLGGVARDPRRSIPSWLSLRAPWLTIAEANALLLEVITKPKRWKARSLGWALKLTEVDRATLHITTIGAVDVSPADRRKARAERKRLDRIAKRRAAGIVPRAEYLAKAIKPKPWQALGISRATWYRNGRPNLPE